MKHHPYFRTLLSGDSSRIAYGARTLNEGGFQSIPRTHFPGGALLGCAAGFVNVPKIKGTHNAMKSGMLAAEAAFDTIAASPATDSDAEVEAETEDGAGDATLHGTPAADMSAYTASLQSSWVYKELNEVRNLRPSFNTALGLWGGLAYSGLDAFVLKGRVPWTFRNRTGKNDAAHTGQEGESGVEKMQYPPFEPPLSTDLLTSLALTGTNHAEDQPVHLRVVGGLQSPKAGSDIEGSAGGPSPTAPEHTETLSARSTHVRVNTSSYAGLLGRACPAGVYEYVNCEEGDVAGTEEGGGWGGHKLVINSQNCIHCKLCDIKVPTQDINWTVPEGGGGPKYSECSYFSKALARLGVLMIT
jgi:electron-transferring-flavoprotein dehydrogenase